MSQTTSLKNSALLMGPLVAFLVGLIAAASLESMAAITVAVTVWCVIWWVTEPVPIPVTSLIPMAVFPLTGVLNGQEVAAAYGSPLIILMLGGFIY